MAITLTSSSFENGNPIPLRHTDDGVNLSPPLAWTDPPVGTKSLALICDDPDAPKKAWVHWVVYDLPPTTTLLPEGVLSGPTLLCGGKQGRTDFGTVGYGGPAPPKGNAHRYYFRLYALDAELNLPPGITKSDLISAMQGHILDTGELMGTYQR
jgi:hypothetical protein